ncbi:hypothetical protein BJ508DRAFT_346457 [Ascobolus immersus RN42]|uniref:Uncharacterized protein n=1 Tax=Ascobolus immersus RN42 TaxID=1160509 RepID=A0A3N4HAC1_ASCIM|nr:hypothetical protein BJ508DRAFT_346457 [Ascobolus immersus RN42]
MPLTTDYDVALWDWKWVNELHPSIRGTGVRDVPRVIRVILHRPDRSVGGSEPIPNSPLLNPKTNAGVYHLGARNRGEFDWLENPLLPPKGNSTKEWNLTKGLGPNKVAPPSEDEPPVRPCGPRRRRKNPAVNRQVETDDEEEEEEDEEEEEEEEEDEEDDEGSDSEDRRERRQTMEDRGPFVVTGDCLAINRDYDVF